MGTYSIMKMILDRPFCVLPCLLWLTLYGGVPKIQAFRTRYMVCIFVLSNIFLCTLIAKEKKKSLIETLQRFNIRTRIC